MKTKISFFFFSSLFAISKIERIKMHSIKRESKRKKIENKQTKMKIFSAFFFCVKEVPSAGVNFLQIDNFLLSLSRSNWTRFRSLVSLAHTWTNKTLDSIWKALFICFAMKSKRNFFFQWIKILQRKISFHQLLTPPPMSLSLSFSLSGIRFLSLFSFVVEFYVWVWFLKHKFNLKLSLTKINIREKSHDWISLSFWNTFSLLPPFFLFAVDFVNFDCYFSIDSLNN